MLTRTARHIRILHHNRLLHSSAHLRRQLFDPSSIDRVSEDVDVCIVGAGPAGLSAAIRLKQLEQKTGKEFRVVVLEKGAEVGTYFDMTLNSPRFTVPRPRLPYSLRSCH
jgi:electron-transferring-flavoprotein dehydrogenase